MTFGGICWYTWAKAGRVDTSGLITPKALQVIIRTVGECFWNFECFIFYCVTRCAICELSLSEQILTCICFAITARMKTKLKCKIHVHVCIFVSKDQYNRFFSSYMSIRLSIRWMSDTTFFFYTVCYVNSTPARQNDTPAYLLRTGR